MISLGIIPARGGSKSVPLKNIRELCGKPLIVYTIESSRNAKLLSRLIVSTDHEQIAEVSRKYGCEVIYRPAKLATDVAPTEWTILHALKNLKEREGYSPDKVLTLQPTSPFRKASLINKCINILRNTDADSVVGVVATRDCYGKIFKGQFKFIFPDQKHRKEKRRRQDREPLYWERGTIYATRTDILLKTKFILGNKIYPIVVSELEGVDINTELDFKIAESL